MTHPRSYYGQRGGLRNPFGSTGKRPAPVVLPPLPTTEAEALTRLRNALSKEPQPSRLACYPSRACYESTGRWYRAARAEASLLSTRLNRLLLP